MNYLNLNMFDGVEIFIHVIRTKKYITEVHTFIFLLSKCEKIVKFGTIDLSQYPPLLTYFQAHLQALAVSQCCLVLLDSSTHSPRSNFTLQLTGK